MSGDPLGIYDYRPGDGNNVLLQKILRAASALPGSMGIPEAPIDGQPYARMNAGWVVAAGGVSVIAGVVDVHGDLPVTVGSPVVNSAYLVRESSGAWLPFYDTRKAGGIWIRQFNLGNLDDWVYSGELQATQNASNFTVYDPTDPTKELGFSAAGITAGARRILTPLDKNYTLEETGHKAKHENGGSDEISVAGLSGVLADPQPPIIGALATQAVAGNDARLSDARTPTAHKTSHENGGTDEISVAGLSGVLADPQPPIIGAGATQAVAGNDARLTDERVPTAAGLTSKFSTNKASIADGDKLAALNSASADAPVHVLWSLVKSTLKTYFDGLYQTTLSFGTGVLTAIGVNVGTAGSVVVNGGALGTPSSGTLSGTTDYPVASTSRTGATPQATAPAAGLLSVLAIANGETVRTDKAIFDTTNPAALGSVGPGTQVIAARRDHVHAMPSAADVGALPVAGGTMTGTLTQAENSAIALDPALSADEKYCGIVQTGTAGTALVFGDSVYFDGVAANNKWELTDADDSAKAGPVKIGICVQAAAENAATTILLWGKVRADAVFPSFTVGASVYLGLTAGDLVHTETWGTDDVIRMVGHAEDANTIWFTPSNDYITHTG